MHSFRHRLQNNYKTNYFTSLKIPHFTCSHVKLSTLNLRYILTLRNDCKPGPSLAYVCVYIFLDLYPVSIVFASKCIVYEDLSFQMHAKNANFAFPVNSSIPEIPKWTVLPFNLATSIVANWGGGRGLVNIHKQNGNVYVIIQEKDGKQCKP